MIALDPQQPAGASHEVLYVTRQPPREQAEMFADFPDLIGTQEIAEALKISPQTVRNLIKRKELPGLKIGNRLFVPKSELVECVTEKIEKGGGYK